ncbi:hypothetical protein [Microbispora siamensis]|nr:hypothetical protein [Microbispora siamensis]
MYLTRHRRPLTALLAAAFTVLGGVAAVSAHAAAGCTPRPRR